LSRGRFRTRAKLDGSDVVIVESMGGGGDEDEDGDGDGDRDCDELERVRVEMLDRAARRWMLACDPPPIWPLARRCSSRSGVTERFIMSCRRSRSRSLTFWSDVDDDNDDDDDDEYDVGRVVEDVDAKELLVLNEPSSDLNDPWESCDMEMRQTRLAGDVMSKSLEVSPSIANPSNPRVNPESNWRKGSKSIPALGDDANDDDDDDGTDTGNGNDDDDGTDTGNGNDDGKGFDDSKSPVGSFLVANIDELEVAPILHKSRENKDEEEEEEENDDDPLAEARMSSACLRAHKSSMLNTSELGIAVPDVDVDADGIAFRINSDSSIAKSRQTEMAVL